MPTQAGHTLQDTAKQSFALKNVKTECSTVSKNRAWEYALRM